MMNAYNGTVKTPWDQRIRGRVFLQIIMICPILSISSLPMTKVTTILATCLLALAC